MKHRRTVFFLGAILTIGLALIAISARFMAPQLSSIAFDPFMFATVNSSTSTTSQTGLNLECNSKVPGGLAQCGSQASSCKNCHEVKGEDPVNTKGDWHTAHAFGDFCEFCHGGNVQATDKDAAHQGLVAPLGDVKTNCASCHADDYQAKAETYATALGVTVGAGGTGTGNGGAAQPPSEPSNASESAAQPSEPQGPAASATVPAGTQIVDYTQPNPLAAPVNAGNVILGVLLALVVVGGGAFVFWNERRLRRQAASKTTQGYVTYETGSPQTIAAGSAEAIAEPIGELKPELAKLLPVLQSLDSRTLRALRIILSDRKRGEEMLQSLSLINFSVLEEMKRLDKRELSLLLALASEA